MHRVTLCDNNGRNGIWVSAYGVGRRPRSMILLALLGAARQVALPAADVEAVR